MDLLREGVVVFEYWSRIHSSGVFCRLNYVHQEPVLHGVVRVPSNIRVFCRMVREGGHALFLPDRPRDCHPDKLNVPDDVEVPVLSDTAWSAGVCSRFSVMATLSLSCKP